MVNTTENTAFADGVISANGAINIVCTGLLLFDCVSLSILSIIWLIYFSRKLVKDYKIYKQTLESKNLISEYQFRNYLRNFVSHRVKNIFLMFICVSELILITSIIVYEVGRFDVLHTRKRAENMTSSIRFTSQFDFSRRYYYSRINIISRLSTILTSISMYLLFISVRILTQYMVHKYAFYKSELKLKCKMVVSLISILILVTLGLIPSLLFLHFILMVPVVAYEFFLILIATKKLRLFLKQRLSDAFHEYQSRDVIRYYSIISREYRYCSIVLLTALLFHLIGFSILNIHPLVMTCISFKSNWSNVLIYGTDQRMYVSIHFDKNAFIYNRIVCSIAQIMMTLGISLQIIPYLFVSIRRAKRYIEKKRKLDKQISSMNSLIEKLIRQNNDAYMYKY